MRRKHRTPRNGGDASGAARPSVATINRIARQQHGLVTRAQLLDLGMGARSIDRRVESGRLIRVRRGIYRVGPIPQPLEAEMAAVLSIGDGAVLSHHTAAVLHRLLPNPDQDGLVHVTVQGCQLATSRTSWSTARGTYRPTRSPAETGSRSRPPREPSSTSPPPSPRPRSSRSSLKPTAAAPPPRPSCTPLLPATRGGRVSRRWQPCCAARRKFSRSRPERRLLDAFRPRGPFPRPKSPRQCRRLREAGSTRQPRAPPPRCATR